MALTLFMVEQAVADWPRSLEWYRDRLGLPVVLLDAPHGFALFTAGPARIALKAGIPAPEGTKLVFEVPDLTAEMDRLRDHGIEPEAPPTVSPEGYRSATVRDPDGYRVVLFEWTGG